MTSGPAADYPMVIGEPYAVGGVNYTPSDTMNYDQVGYGSASMDGGSGISAAHHTLPVPSYIEVTSLESGRTILVRVERRGPMASNNLVELSPGAAAQLGVVGIANAPVRVRRVNPPEQERSLLRSGQRASDRMETPKSLLGVLMRKLDPGAAQAAVALPSGRDPAASAAVAPPKPAVVPPRVAARRPARPAPVAVASPEAEPTAVVAHPAATAPVPRRIPAGSVAIQAGAFASKDRADAAAAKIGGQVSRAGAVWRVRKGPFATRAEAEAALAQVRAAGYSDARIQRAD